MKEEDILHENGNHWISQARNGNFTVWTAGATHSTSEIEFEPMENLIQYTILLIFSLPSIAAAYFIALDLFKKD
jgi:hypothetical protein